MKCARLHLHERSNPRPSPGRAAAERPQRFCRRRLVDPAHGQDPRWADLMDRLYCNPNADTTASEGSAVDNIHPRPTEDLFLSVLNIKFDGDVKESKRPKTCFKYKAISDGRKHRMFVKQVVEEEENNAEDCSSQLTYLHDFDHYVKYILNPEPTAATSEKSSLLLCELHNKRENKSVQVESRLQGSDSKKCGQLDSISKNNAVVKQVKDTVKDDLPDLSSEDTKIAYHKSGKRKCLTISRAQSPETVQVIRVDVVCSYRHGSELSGPDDARKPTHPDQPTEHNPKTINHINMKTAHFSNKYLLTNTTKTLDESVSGGAKVTLLCKTFRLSKRTKPNNKKAYVKNQSEE